MEKKKKTNSNTNLAHIKILNYPVYPPLNFQIKSLFEPKPRKNSVIQLAKAPKHLSRFKNITQDQVIKILSKNKKLRIDVENRIVADYLTDHFDYFNQIIKSSRERFLKLISVLNFETVPSNTIIINIGEDNNNFYVLFEGTIVVYRQYKYKKDMTISEFCKILKKEKIQNLEKYNNIIKNNSHLDLNFENIMIDEYYYLSLKNKIFNFNFEELEEIGIYKEGYSFGELSLLNNKKTKDIIIKSVTKCKLIYISKFDFNRILRTLEEKRIEKKANLFKKNFPIFKLWSMEQLITLFNYCTQKIFSCEEFIYKQNDENEYIYFVEEGTIAQFTNVSFSWYLQFIEYIKNSNNNLLEIIKNMVTEISVNNRSTGEYNNMLYNIIKKIKLENNNRKNYEKYPFFNIENIYMKKKKDLIEISELYSREKQKEKFDNILKIKFEENDINNPEKVYKIPINTSDNPRILGLEETFELKKRFTTVECISGQVKAKKIKIIDLLRILYYYRDFNYINNFLDIIYQKKSILCETIKIHLQRIGINFENTMNAKYEKMITQPTILSYKNSKKNIFEISNKIKNEVIVAIKLKSWNNGSYLDNILDTSLNLINPKSFREIKLEKKNKYKKLNDLLKKKYSSNEKTLFSTKNFFSKITAKMPLYLSKSKKLKLKSLDKKDINNKKERCIDYFFRTSVFHKKRIGKSRNIKEIYEEKKNEDSIKIKSYNNYFINNNNKLEYTDRRGYLKKDLLLNNYINYKKPFKKLINYKVSEDYFEDYKNKNSINENDNDGINSLSSLTKEKETENDRSVISTNDKEKKEKFLRYKKKFT